ncbi:MAG: hypothetical protein KAJ73_01085 [Zetaproteobacteria bacterium]|nr:hypothetical protein [Zetaproteobacteria bacterium]
MGTAVRKLEIRIDQTGDAKKGVSGLSGGLGALAGPAGIAAAAIAAVGTATFVAGAKLISMGSDAEEMIGKFDVVFGDSAPMATEKLDEFGNAVGRSKFELMEMAATVQDTFVPLGFARDEAADMSIELSKLAVDMGSFNNVADADVMLALQSAIVGNHETMRKYGVVITQSTLDQELLRMGVEDGIKAATEQEKVQARLNLIYAGTSDAQGDAERTAGSWANQMRALKSTISETATSIGLELLPFVTPLLTAITDLARKALPPLLEGFKEVMGHIKTELQPVLKELFAAFGEIFESLGLGTGEVDWLKLAIDGLKIGITLIANVLGGFAVTLGHVADAVRAVGDAVKWLTGKWDDMKQAARDAIAAIPRWLRPGSPTPFELGLRGIGKAMADLDFGKMAPAPGAAPGMVAGGAGGITVNLTYAPAVSLADRFEAEEKLAPFIANALRTQLGVA